MHAGVSGAALVLGGSGTVGSEVVRQLAGAGVPVVFTYFRGRERAEALLAELPGARAARIDLRDGAAIQELVRGLPSEELPAIILHCAAVGRFVRIGEVSDAAWDEASAVNCRAPFQLCREVLTRACPRSVVLVGAMDRAQSLPLPVHFAATQGALAAMTVALAKELGPTTLVNMVALGPLEAEGGLSRGLSPRLLEDYQKFSALRRKGTPVEAARAIVWLARENRYMSGKVLSVNGGI